MDKVEELLRQCDLFLSIGTSGVVFPAASFVQTAKYYGAETYEFNLENLNDGKEEVKIFTLKEFFREHLLPLALTFGMSTQEFWHEEPDLLWTYRKVYMEKLKILIIGIISHSVSIMADAVNNIADMASATLTIIGFKLSNNDSYLSEYDSIEFLISLSEEPENAFAFVTRSYQRI